MPRGHLLKPSDRIKWVRDYREFKNHRAQLRREKLLLRWLRALNQC